MIEEQITLDMLTRNSVSVKRQKYIMQEGQKYKIEQPWRRLYVNSENGRKQMRDELEEPYLSAVLAVWGDKATVDDDVENILLP